MKTFAGIIIMLIATIGFGQTIDTENLGQNETKIVKSDTLFKPNYPEGIYKSKKDFLKMKPSSNELVDMRGFFNVPVDSIIHNPYFYYVKTDKKVKNVFAISYQGHLYFQLESVLKNKNRNRKDKAQGTNHHNKFVRVIMGGEKLFLYRSRIGKCLGVWC